MKAGSVFEFVLVGRARSMYDAFTPEEQAEIDRAIRLLELDPWPDKIRKSVLAVSPLILNAYDDGRWQITYRVVDYRFIEIFAISWAI